MKCRYCNVALSPLRTLTDGEFCSDEHRTNYLEHGVPLRAPSLQEAGLVPLDTALESAVPTASTIDATAPPVAFQPGAVAQPASPSRPSSTWLRLADGLFSLKWKGDMFNSAAPGLPQGLPENPFPAVPVVPAVSTGDLGEEIGETRLGSLRLKAGRSWHWLADTWRKTPSELKIVTFILPVLLAVAVSPSLPKVKVPAANGVQHMLKQELNTFNKSVVDRAAIAYTDDFRAGLDGWESRSNLTSSWSYDATGFVRPGPLAVFRPTVDMTDYRMEFLAEIDQKGLGCAFRAPNLDNYYAVKFEVVKPGPLPIVHLVRYAVINGKEGPRVERPLPLTVRADMLYRVRIEVRGNDFAVMTQGQMVDFFSDSRIPRGGVGLFCGHGERARVRWVEVSHQYDTLGRLCAYLAPYGFEGRNGNFN